MYLAFQIVAAVYGTGRHRSDLTDEENRTALMVRTIHETYSNSPNDHQFWYLCELLYILVNCLLKFAIGYFYLRVAMQRWHVWAIKILMAGTVFFGIVYFFLVMLQCLPG